MSAAEPDDPEPTVSSGSNEDHAAAFEAVLAPLRDASRGATADSISMVGALEQAASPSGEVIVKVAGLGKTFDSRVALDNVSFAVHAGEILGLLGPIGAGKTTCLRILATLLKPDTGSTVIAGHDLNDLAKVRVKIGYLPDFTGTYEDLYVWEYLEFFARAYAVKPDQRQSAIARVLGTTGLSDQRDSLIQGLSQDQKQFLALARLLMHEPSVLLLDEPLAGLSPTALAGATEILRDLRQSGVAIVISSARLEDLVGLADTVVLLDAGRVLTFTTTDKLLRRLRDSRRWRVRLTDEEESERLRLFLHEQPEVTQVARSGLEVLVAFKGEDSVIESIHQRLFDSKFRLLEFAEEPYTPEEIQDRIAGAG